ncbi:hypothetical protein VPH35_089757 [Triticum aestivum]
MINPLRPYSNNTWAYFDNTPKRTGHSKDQKKKHPTSPVQPTTHLPQSPPPAPQPSSHFLPQLARPQPPPTVGAHLATSHGHRAPTPSNHWRPQRPWWEPAATGILRGLHHRIRPPWPSAQPQADGSDYDRPPPARGGRMGGPTSSMPCWAPPVPPLPSSPWAVLPPALPPRTFPASRQSSTRVASAPAFLPATHPDPSAPARLTPPPPGAPPPPCRPRICGPQSFPGADLSEAEGHRRISFPFPRHRRPSPRLDLQRHRQPAVGCAALPLPSIFWGADDTTRYPAVRLGGGGRRRSPA